MSYEIGFIHMCASILSNGFIDGKILECENYKKEKSRVKSLMIARYDIERIRERSQPLIANLIKKELSNWWKESRYNVQINAIREEIMDFLANELKKMDKEIICINNQNIYIKSFSDGDFADISSLIENRWPGMIFYYEPTAKIITTPLI